MPERTVFSRAIDAVLAASTSRRSHVHGEQHWQRVCAHGLHIAEATSGTDPLVVALFGLFHDSMRANDGIDPGHGSRGGDLARRLSGSLGLDEARLGLLAAACADHTKGRTSADPTIGACWDSDRLDLVRLGYAIDWKRLSTEAARSREAVARAVALLWTPPAWEEIERRLAEIVERQGAS